MQLRPQKSAGARKTTEPFPLKPLLFILAAKAYGLLILYVLFLRTPLREGDLGFLFQDLGEFRADRRVQIETSFWQRLTPFDGQWYQDISFRGYRQLAAIEIAQRDIPPGNYAFFPLLPGILGVARAIAPTHYLPLTILVLVYCSALGAYFVLQTARALKVPELLSVILLVCFPTALFQLALYTEGDFLCFSALTLYFVVKKKLLGAALCGLLASLCRPQGVLLALPILIDFFWPALDERPASFRRLGERALLPRSHP